jgi:DNA polymerase
LKDRPPENRDPSTDEIKIYAPFLDRQIDIIKPKVVATLGRFSMEYIMKRFGLEKELQPIGKMHGKIFKDEGFLGDITLVPLYHPAVAVYNRNELPNLLEDFKVLKEFI